MLPRNLTKVLKYHVIKLEKALFLKQWPSQRHNGWCWIKSTAFLWKQTVSISWSESERAIEGDADSFPLRPSLWDSSEVVPRRPPLSTCIINDKSPKPKRLIDGWKMDVPSTYCFRLRIRWSYLTVHLSGWGLWSGSVVPGGTRELAVG